MKKPTVIILFYLAVTAVSAQSWAQIYFDNPYERFSARSLIERTIGNGFIMAGGYNADITSFSFNDPAIITLSEDGIADDFHIPFSSPARTDEIRQIIASQGGGYLLAGDSQNFLDGEPSEHFVAKLNENFELVWKTEFAGQDQDLGNGVMESTDGSIITYGAYGKGYVSTTSGGVTVITSLYDGHVAQLAPTGEITWEYVVEGFDQCIFREGFFLNDGKILVTGSLYDVEEMQGAEVVALLNENGEEIWLRELAVEAYGRRLIPLLQKDGTIYLAGQKLTSTYPQHPDEGLLLHELSLSGEIITSSQFDIDGQNAISRVRLGGNGNIYLAGSEFIDDDFLNDLFFMEVDFAGNMLQKTIVPIENYSELLNDFIVRPNGELFLLGRAIEAPPGMRRHVFLTKLSVSVPIREITAGEAAPVRVFPVPASDLVLFSFEGKPLSDPAEIFISDSSGRVIRRATMRDERHLLERSGLPAGAYYYQIRSGQKLIASGQLYFQ